jgi:hypothetical protein
MGPGHPAHPARFLARCQRSRARWPVLRTFCMRSSIRGRSSTRSRKALATSQEERTVATEARMASNGSGNLQDLEQGFCPPSFGVQPGELLSIVGCRTRPSAARRCLKESPLLFIPPGGMHQRRAPQGLAAERLAGGRSPLIPGSPCPVPARRGSRLLAAATLWAPARCAPCCPRGPGTRSRAGPRAGRWAPAAPRRRRPAPSRRSRRDRRCGRRSSAGLPW